MFAHYDRFAVDVTGTRICGRVSRAEAGPSGGAGPAPALLLLHGHPESHLMWHRVADQLAGHFTVVAPDLRGYGASGAPLSGPDHTAYSKRVMAADLLELMARMGAERGFGRFAIAAHDRGARVAARLVADHPEAVTRAVLMDIAPTLDMYAGTSREFAEAYFHWFFLIQPAPLPERLISADPRAYLEGVMGGRHAGLAPFPPEVLDSYADALADPDHVHALCEDYRAAATIDLDHDRADREAGRRIAVPLRILWGRHGVVERHFQPLPLWSAIAEDVTGRALDCGHYLPEEAPDDVLAEILDFIPTTEESNP